MPLPNTWKQMFTSLEIELYLQLCFVSLSILQSIPYTRRQTGIPFTCNLLPQPPCTMYQTQVKKKALLFFFRSTYCPKYPLCQILILLVQEKYYRQVLEFHFYIESNAFLFKVMGHTLTLEPLITESHKRFSTTTRFLKRLQSHAESTLSSNSGRIHQDLSQVIRPEMTIKCKILST